jgi:hypothetical protein
MLWGPINEKEEAEKQLIHLTQTTSIGAYYSDFPLLPRLVGTKPLS